MQTGTFWQRLWPRRKKQALAASAAVLSAAAAFVAPWEGLRTTAYLDRLAVPPVWTVCYGETRGVSRGQSYSEKDCHDRRLQGLGTFREALMACLPGLEAQPQGLQVALISWTYNVGAGAACGSTLVRHARAGNWQAACGELARWSRAGGRVIPGLTRRRSAEATLCFAALKEEAQA